MKPKLTYIIRRDSEYLVAIAYSDSKTARWSPSAWDAVRIPWLDEAQKVARIFGAEIVRFSNVDGVIE